MKPPMTSATNNGGIIKRVFTASRPQAEILGTKLRWCVRSMRELKLNSSPGISVKTASRLRIMDFISTSPRS